MTCHQRMIYICYRHRIFYLCPDFRYDRYHHDNSHLRCGPPGTPIAGNLSGHSIYISPCYTDEVAPAVTEITVASFETKVASATGPRPPPGPTLLPRFPLRKHT